MGRRDEEALLRRVCSEVSDVSVGVGTRSLQPTRPGRQSCRSRAARSTAGVRVNLNVGSGAITTPLAGWISLDAMAWPCNVRADARSLPFRDGSFEQVHCSHLIEHIAIEEASKALVEIRRVLRTTGIFYIAAPDSRRARDAGSTYWAKVSRWGGATAGWDHKWECTIPKLRKLLEEAGLVPRWITAIPTGWPPNTHQWPIDFEVRFICRRDDCPWPSSFPPTFSTIV